MKTDEHGRYLVPEMIDRTVVLRLRVLAVTGKRNLPSEPGG